MKLKTFKFVNRRKADRKKYLAFVKKYNVLLSVHCEYIQNNLQIHGTTNTILFITDKK